MMLNISIKVHENILNGFQVVERTRFYHCRISKGNYSKIVWTRVTVLVFSTSPDDALYLVMGPKKKKKKRRKKTKWKRRQIIIDKNKLAALKRIEMKALLLSVKHSKLRK